MRRTASFRLVEYEDLTVGVIDDDFQVRESIGSLLEAAGHVPQVFSPAEEFLERGEPGEVECLIIDVRMPGMDGIELQQRLRVEHASLPIIFISGHLDDEARRRAFDGGALDFFYKPFDAADLMNAIDRASDGSPNHPI
jgi:FixJ family two-component response regulator